MTKRMPTLVGAEAIDATPVRVIKLGGSLLTRPDWPGRLNKWLAEQSPADNLLLVGGGEIVEAVRELDRAHHFPQSFTHWLCIELMTATFQIARQLLPEFRPVTAPQQFHQLFSQAFRKGPADQTSPANYLIQVSGFYSQDAHTSLLAEDWSTTSDSLAAWLAWEVQADELVLLKSVAAPPAPASGRAYGEHLACQGIVDAGFPSVWNPAQALRIVKLTD